jgi:O-antigen/teichoic acid export membrane protein
VTSITAMLYARFDLLLLGLWQGEMAAGWYGAAYRLWETIGMLPSSLLDALFPEMSRLSGRDGGRRSLRRLFVAGVWAMLGGGLLLALLVGLSAGGLLSLIYGAKGDHAAAEAPLQLLAAAIPAMCLYLLSGHTLYALDRQRRVTIAMLVVGLLNIGLNLVVIRRWSYVGCAAVAVVTEWLLCTLLLPQARRALAE